MPRVNNRPPTGDRKGRRATKTSGDSPLPDEPFRFLDLPAELRKRILSLALHGEYCGVPHLTSVKLPAVTTVNKQLCAEALPVFFAESKWEVSVRSNIKASYIIRVARKSAPPTRSCDTEFFRAEQAYAGSSVGKMLISDKTELWLQNFGSAISCIRTIDINVNAKEENDEKPRWEGRAFCTVSIRKNAGKAPTSVAHTHTIGLNEVRTEPKLNDVVARLEDKIKVADARPNFRGFSLEDLKSFLGVFNVQS